MSTETNNLIIEFVDELKRLNVKVIRPDINECFLIFELLKILFYMVLVLLRT